MTASGAPLFLGLDVGTQSTKAVLVDGEKLTVVARGQVEYGLIEGLPDGAAEQDPRTWIDAATRATRSVLQGVDATRVAGIGVSGQQHGAVLLDASFEPVRAAKLWCDTETAPEAERLSKQLGRAVPAGFTAPKLRYTADREPDLWERTAHVLLPHDFLNAWLTRRLFTEAGDASGTGYVDPVTGAYDTRAMECTAPGLADRVPEIVSPAGVAGELCAPAAEALGLPAGIAVSAGGGDNMMSAIGSGATRAGVVTCSLGTSGTVFAYEDRPILDPEGAIAAFRASSAGPDGAAGHLPLLCVMNCTSPLVALRDLTGQSHDALTALAQDVSPGANGALFVPFLAGERTPNLPSARGVMRGLGVSSLTAGALYRTTLEGVTLGLAAGLDRMRALGAGPSEVRLVGGAAGNALWREILATMFGVPVRALAEQETAAVGAAVQACAAVRGASVDELSTAFAERESLVTEPRADWAEVYAEVRARYDEEVARFEA